MKSQANIDTAWPELPKYDAWQDSASTLHLWTQIVGKIRLATSPWINHSWGSTLYVTARGLTTSPMPYRDAGFSIDFDFVEHALRISTSRGDAAGFALQPMSVADFHRKLMQVLAGLGIEVTIFTLPVEVPEAIRFEDDEQHASYDAAAVNRWFRTLLQVDRVFNIYRTGFIGKTSPVHFFWGAFDLAVTRFSGRTAPLHPGGVPNCADWVMQEAYSHELASAGFWPGAGFGEAAFYAYAYPEPKDYNARRIEPAAAYYSDSLKEFILPYEAVRTSGEPDRALLAFLQRAYENAADLAEWDRAVLERDVSPGK